MGSPANPDEFLAHFGVAGMKWGRRKSHSSSSKSHHAPKSKPDASQLRPVSKDAKNAETFQRVAKTQGTQALSNKQLQDLVNRQNLEQQYSRLNPAPISAGEKIWKRLQPTIGVVQPAIGAAVKSQWESRQPQRPAAEPVKALVPYSKPSMNKLVGTVALAAGKQVLQEHGLDIGLAIVKALLK